MRKLAFRLVAFCAAAIAALAVAEVLVRTFRKPVRAHTLEFRNVDGSPVDPVAAIESGELISLPAEQSALGHPVLTFGPGIRFKLCYEDLDRPWLDRDGCVEVRINSAGIRERESLAAPKPAGQRRIVCLGDSVTFGYGVPIEACWTRLVEAELRRFDDGIRTVNCGFAASQLADEYWLGLRHRFHRFEPDLVLVTLCLNDLIPINAGMAHMLPPIRSSSAFLSELRDLWRGGRLALDPATDHGARLLDAGPGHPRYRQNPSLADRLWRSGTPQDSLRAMRDWCDARGVGFAVVLWPLFQGLEEGASYPFETVHTVVGAFCETEQIPLLDLLPTFRGQASTSLWVAPNDAHGNPTAQRIATPAIAAFAARALGLR